MHLQRQQSLNVTYQGESLSQYLSVTDPIIPQPYCEFSFVTELGKGKVVQGQECESTCIQSSSIDHKHVREKRYIAAMTDLMHVRGFTGKQH